MRFILCLREIRDYKNTVVASMSLSVFCVLPIETFWQSADS